MHCITADALPERLSRTTLADAGITEADLQGWIIAHDPWAVLDHPDHNMRANVCVVLGNVRPMMVLTTSGK